MRSNLLTTNIQARMFSWMCARRLTGGARRESESASYSPTSRVCRVFDFFNLSFFRRDHPAFRKVEIKWSAISKWPSHTISFLFFDKWTLLPLYSFVLGSGRSISFPLCTQSRGKAVWHKWRQGAHSEDSHEKSLETKTWSSCCLLKARWSNIWWAWEQWTYAHKQVYNVHSVFLFFWSTFASKCTTIRRVSLMSHRLTAWHTDKRI